MTTSKLKIVFSVLMAALCSAYAATVRTATEGFVTNRIAAAIAAIPAPDYSPTNAELRATIEAVAPAPGDYETVSNRAMKAVQTTDMDWLDVVARTSRITNDTFGTSYFFKGTADNAYNLMSEDGSHLLFFYNGRWTGFDWAGIRYRSMAYLSDVSDAATAATNYTDAATANAVKLSENKPEENARIVLWDYDAASNNPRVAGPTNIRIGDLVPGDYENVSNRAMKAVQTHGGSATNLQVHGELWIWDSYDPIAPLVIHPYYSGDYFWFENGKYGLEARRVNVEFPTDRTEAYMAYKHDIAAAANAATNYTAAAVAGKLDAELDYGYRIYYGPNGLTAIVDYGNSDAETFEFTRRGIMPNGNTVARLSDIPESVTPTVVTNIVRELSLGGIWDAELEVWWTPVMVGGSLTYQATTNVNLNAEN